MNDRLYIEEQRGSLKVVVFAWATRPPSFQVVEYRVGKVARMETWGCPDKAREQAAIFLAEGQSHE